uniref:Uncharacterized protein n=1 Tax=Romanomermis culicivorax TaxID=13658 RepID=A0A915L1Y7_ROMCU
LIFGDFYSFLGSIILKSKLALSQDVKFEDISFEAKYDINMLIPVDIRDTTISRREICQSMGLEPIRPWSTPTPTSMATQDALQPFFFSFILAYITETVDQHSQGFFVVHQTVGIDIATHLIGRLRALLSAQVGPNIEAVFNSAFQ